MDTLTSSPTKHQTTSTSVPFGGVSGQRQDYFAISGDNPPGGSPGRYRVVFTLGKDLQPSLNIDFDPNMAGDSHIIVPNTIDDRGPETKGKPDPDAQWGHDPAADAFIKIRIEATTPEGYFKFYGHANPNGRLARLVGEVDGQSFHEASTKTWKAIASSMSDWSAQLDIPVLIQRVHITEIKTGSQMVSWTAPYLDTPLAIRGTGQSSRAYRGFASLYREGLCSNSPQYQFLCFFKIIEGLRKRRKRLEREAKKSSLPPPAIPDESFPSTEAEFTPWLSTIFHVKRNWDEMAFDSFFPRNIRGLPFSQVIDTFLEPLRDEIAHALLEGEVDKPRGESVTPDAEELSLSEDLSRSSKVEHCIPVIKCVVRRMMKNDLDDYLSFIDATGVVRA